MTVQTTAGWRFYEQQLAYLRAGDVDNLVDDHYTEDAELVGFGQQVRGRQALKEYFQQYLAVRGDLEVLSTDSFVETPDTIMYEATVVSNLGQARVYGAFVLRDGKISHQFSGVFPR